MANTPINEILREKRIKKGITLEQVFYEVHIPSKFVRMIEDGAWDKFQSQLHMKGFIRLYGKYLDIPASVIEEGIRVIEKNKEAEEKKQDETEEKKKEDRIVPKEYLYLLFILIVIFGILYFLTLYFLPE
ncbi:MAG: helix-turn-helix domain-containing protein [Candidatus Omnitrophica bacterium]|nr:helix-turn-helix domain-containing protein [Candidatus Omnitrophota bacterium]MCM8777226.1 helix-turn-helix domain-containing protein [Candidatus Omnitrophota bacterium]